MEYEVFTDLDPEALSAAAISVFQRWVAFSLGFAEIGGHTVLNPTGRMAQSIRIEEKAPNLISVVTGNKEAEILESGHARVDLKNYLVGGKAYPMHRGTATSVPLLPAVMGGRVGVVAARARAAGATGFARVPSTITPENASSWVIPAMAAWTPAAYLAEMLRNGDL
jgi:hypothetical protein